MRGNSRGAPAQGSPTRSGKRELTAEEREFLSEALKRARNAAGGIEPLTVAMGLRLAPSTYYQYESGKLAPPGHLRHALTHFYSGFTVSARTIGEAWDSVFKDKPFTLLETLARESPDDCSKAVYALNREVLNLAYDGHIWASRSLVHQTLPIVKRIATAEPTRNAIDPGDGTLFAIAAARTFLYRAEFAAGAALLKFCKETWPLPKGSLRSRVDYATFLYRARMMGLKGLDASREFSGFRRHLRRERLVATNPDSAQWDWLEYEAARNEVVSLAHCPGPEEVEHYASIREQFREWFDESEYARTRRVARLRVHAAFEDPEAALDELVGGRAEPQTRAETTLYREHSISIAEFRKGERTGAIKACLSLISQAHRSDLLHDARLMAEHLRFMERQAR